MTELSDVLIRWLASGERGISSDTIVQYLTGVQCLRTYPPHHPCDPDDLRRCIVLLDLCPELKDQFPRMAELSPTWARLVDNWPGLVKLFWAEANGKEYWRAPKTYERMKELGC